MEYNGITPHFNTERKIRILKGRHPLLDAKKVVPIDISLGSDFDQLVITGPNTGVKNCGTSHSDGTGGTSDSFRRPQ